MFKKLVVGLAMSLLTLIVASGRGRALANGCRTIIPA